MSAVAQTLPKLAVVVGGPESPKQKLPRHIERQLTTGETIFWSTGKQYQTKGREGKWVAEIRRKEYSVRKDYPVRGFDHPQDALKYVLSTRTNSKAAVAIADPAAPTPATSPEAHIHEEACAAADSPRDTTGAARRWERTQKQVWGRMHARSPV